MRLYLAGFILPALPLPCLMPVARLAVSALALLCLPVGSLTALPPPPARNAAAPSGAIPVTLEQDHEGNWRLLRGGEPYFIRGAGGAHHHERVTEFGGNSIRTWGVNQLVPRDDQGRNVLDRAHELGLTVTVGIWIQQIRRGFDFNDPVVVQRQRDYVREAVRTYRDHPAVLVWGLGNEPAIAVAGENAALWQELNVLARIIKEEDPHHPVMTVVSGLGEEKLRALQIHYTEIDILGINAYGGALRAPEVLAKIGWTKPWALTEFGPRGPWEVPKTAWGAPIEQTAEEKAALYRRSWEAGSLAGSSQFLGGYAFIWGHKQEGSSTWFGMFLPTGERTPATDVMAQLWTGQWPADRCPEITDWSVPFAEASVAPGAETPVSVTAIDPEGQPLTVTWWIMAEAIKPGVGGDREAVPESFHDTVAPTSATTAVIRAPNTPGNYRLFVKAVDPAGAASVRNTPFQVTTPE